MADVATVDLNQNFYTLSTEGMLEFMQQLWQHEMQKSTDLEGFLDAIDPYVCTKIELVEAMRMALMCGAQSVAVAMHEIYLFRLTAATITGLPFH